jgi:hypothetical protein
VKSHGIIYSYFSKAERSRAEGLDYVNWTDDANRSIVTLSRNMLAVNV